MKKKDISRLLQRYLDACEKGKEPYFDTDDLCELLESFEESDDYTHFDAVLALGLQLHPGNIDLQIRQCNYYIYNEEYDSALALIDTIAVTDHQELDLLRLECFCMLKQYDKITAYTEDIARRNCDYLETVFEFVTPFLSDQYMNKEASDFLKRGIALFPNNLVLKSEQCYLLEMKGDIDGAIVLCNELIDKDPYSHDYWFTLGRLHSIKMEFDKAIDAFDFALTCDDSDSELKILKAYCLFMNENYEKALEVYKEVQPDSGIIDRIKQLMAECYIKLEKYEEAYKALKELIEKDACSEPSTYIHFMRCCTETDRDKEASSALSKALALFPNNVQILSLLALTHVENGEDILAIKTTERLFDVLDQEKDYQPEDYERLLQTGQQLYMQGEIDNALKYFQKVLEVNPDMPYIHLHMAMAYLAKADMQRFSEHFYQTSPQELAEYLENSGISFNDMEHHLMGKHIAPEDLTKEYLNNKDNNN